MQIAANVQIRDSIRIGVRIVPRASIERALPRATTMVTIKLIVAPVLATSSSTINVGGDPPAFVMGRLGAQVEGYNLQAATRVGAIDREGLARMGHYLSRPPIGTDRLSQLEDDRRELRFKRRWRDGTAAFLFTPHELIERLVAQVPRPMAHLTRYHGVLAPAFAARSQIVPAANEADAMRSPKLMMRRARRRPGGRGYCRGPR